jgi:parallel beta-helix repeat protein
MLNMRKDSGSVTQLGLFNDNTPGEISKFLRDNFTYNDVDRCWYGVYLTQSEANFLIKNNAVFEDDDVLRAMQFIGSFNVDYLVFHYGFVIKYSGGVLRVKKGMIKVMSPTYGDDPYLSKLKESLSNMGVSYKSIYNSSGELTEDQLAVGEGYTELF